MADSHAYGAGSGGGHRASHREIEMSMSAIGLTLVGVAINIGTTVGFGMHGEWWIRLVASIGSTGAILAVTAAASRRMNALRRAARWLTNYPSTPDEDGGT